MSDSFIYLYGDDDESGIDGPLPTLATREEVFRALSVIGQVDLVIVGGGLSGVTLARAAALQGCDVLLLEPGYFGERSSAWRDSISGSLTSRPLAVATSLRSLNSVLNEVAPHLVVLREWRDDIDRGLIGRCASWLSRKRWCATSIDSSLSSVPDLDERLLIRETVLAARQEGAFAVSAAAATYVERNVDEGGFRVGVKDLLTGDLIEIHSGCLYIDPSFSQPVTSRVGTPIVRRSLPHGTSLTAVFSVTMSEGADCCTQAYRSFSLKDGALGGVCPIGPGLVEVCVQGPQGAQDPDDLLRRAREVCAMAGYTVREEISQRLHGTSFAHRAKVSFRNGVILSEERVPWDIFSLLPKILSKVPSCGGARRGRRPLPGEWREGERERFIADAKVAEVADATIESVLNRWRGRVRYIPLVEDGFQEVCPGVLRGELSLAALSDQVSSSEDLLFGALRLHTVSDWRAYVAPLHQMLQERKLNPSAQK